MSTCLASHRGAQILSLAAPCFPNSSQFLLSLPEQAVPVLHPRQCLQLPGKLVLQTHPAARRGGLSQVIPMELKVCNLQAIQHKWLRGVVWTSWNTSPPPCAPRSAAGMCSPAVRSGRNSLWLTHESLHFTDAARQSSSRNIWETMKEGLKSKQSKEQFYSVPNTASHLHARRSPISGRIPFGSLGTRLGGFDHQRDRLEEKVIFCSACIYAQLTFTYAQSKRLSVL